MQPNLLEKIVELMYDLMGLLIKKRLPAKAGSLRKLIFIIV
jgi:hypothetical protein